MTHLYEIHHAQRARVVVEWFPMSSTDDPAQYLGRDHHIDGGDLAGTTGESSAAPMAAKPKNPVLAALSHRTFRRMFFGQFASNIGTWMQNVTLISLANAMTKSPTFVGIITFAQLGPMLLLSPFGGVIADRQDRRRTIVLGSSVQALLSLLLAALSWSGHPPQWALVAVVAGIGMAGALMGPSGGALLPSLVGPNDLAGAVALNSASMNGSRVFGPLLAVGAAALGGPGWAFGTALVRGEKRLMLSQGQEWVQFAGIVRLADIDSDNRIASTRVADAKIEYAGNGPVSRAIREVLAKYDPETVRFFLVRTHYRTALNYSDVHLDDARQSIKRLYTALDLVPPAVVGEQELCRPS